MDLKQLTSSFENFLVQNEDVPAGLTEYLQRVLDILKVLQIDKSYNFQVLNEFELLLAIECATNSLFSSQSREVLSYLRDFVISHLPELADELGQKAVDYYQSGYYEKIMNPESKKVDHRQGLTNDKFEHIF